MKKAVKIVFFVLILAVIVVVMHHLPSFDTLIRKIHGR
jgi:hypothetical protein